MGFGDDTDNRAVLRRLNGTSQFFDASLSRCDIFRRSERRIEGGSRRTRSGSRWTRYDNALRVRGVVNFRKLLDRRINGVGFARIKRLIRCVRNRRRKFVALINQACARHIGIVVAATAEDRRRARD